MKLAMLLWLASFLPAQWQDHTCLAATVYLEARDQSLLGQRAVAEVVLRRRDTGRHGEGVCAVVVRSRQFAPGIVSPNYRLRNLTAWNHAWSVASTALREWSRPADERLDVVPGADHFYAHNLVTPKWAQGEPVAVIGDHSFYRIGF